MLKKEYPFLHFLGHNKHKKQMKKVLQYLVTPSQYTLLRELAINGLPGNLCITDKKTKLRKKFKNKLLSLANGKYKKQKLHLLYPILQLLAFNIICFLLPVNVVHTPPLPPPSPLKGNGVIWGGTHIKT